MQRVRASKYTENFSADLGPPSCPLTSMQQPSGSTQTPEPPDFYRCSSHNRSAPWQRSWRALLLLTLVMSLSPSSLGSHVHANKQMRDHIQQVGLLADCLWCGELLSFIILAADTLQPPTKCLTNCLSAAVAAHSIMQVWAACFRDGSSNLCVWLVC